MSAPSPHPPLLSDVELRRAHIWWNLALISPLLYFGLALWLDRQGWAGPGRNGAPAAPNPTVAAPSIEDDPAALGFFCLLWTVLLFGMIWGVKQRMDIARRAPDGNPPPTDPAAAWWRKFFAGLAYADGAALIGLIFFYFVGDMLTILLGGIVAYIGYAFVYPRRLEFLQ